MDRSSPGYNKKSAERMFQAATPNNETVTTYSELSPHRAMEQYEAMIVKLEGEVRSHIRTEHQLKLYIETLNIQWEEKLQE